MIETARALYVFWSSFGLNAYVEGYVPDDAEMPYITYSLANPEWRSQGTHYARLWYRSTSYQGILSKAHEIETAIGDGITLPAADGFVALWKENQFVQLEEDEDVTVKCAYLSLIIEANHS